ncbi:sugar transferase [Geopsychrobacter electrodiphilus]|uniref:sugar transferase n=1 Tax=Geopsychrobacter electrodiphilus TaxID=225196 RepID=UPI00035DD4D6|nr:sugar transferase [Geopsychrobacter electrodiphilus]
MFRQQSKLFNRLSIIVDIVIIIVAFVCAYHFRKPLSGGLRNFREYAWVLFIVVPVWVYLLKKQQLHASIRRLSIFDILSRLISVHFIGGILVASIIYFVDRDQYSRGLYLAFLGFSWAFFSLEKVGLRTGLGLLRRRGYNTRNLLIIGTQKKAQRFCQLIEEHKDWGLAILGFVQIAPGPSLDEVEGHCVLGRSEDLIEICKGKQVDEVVFCIPKDYVVEAESNLQDLEELGIAVRMVVDFFESSFYRKELSLFHNELPILTYHPKAFDSQQLFIKRLIDIGGAVVGLIITGVLLPFIAFALKRDSPGPLFFSQERVGLGGRHFKCWKFRSMYIDAEERKKDLMVENEMEGAMFKIKNDPRVTRVGKFLRKTSLDELPQFWNVFVGEMSLVGTRPPTPAEVSAYENWHRRRISIKPGITGNWQVSGRSEIKDFDAIVRLDLDYIDRWSLWLDVKILFQTIKVVLGREGSF